MSRAVSTTRLIMAAAVTGLVAAGCSERVGRGWDWNRMRSQPRYEAYRGSRFFADGKAMQLPPAGTMSREMGAAVTVLPAAAMLARGSSQFRIYCAVCHGDRGDGVSVVAGNMDDPKPPSLIVPPVSALPASAIASVIATGIGPMPSFAQELSPADRAAVAEYVKTLAVSAPAASSADSSAAQRP
jgi:mono/diheme cytochrome c family protein